MKNRNHGLSEKEMELVQLLLAAVNTFAANSVILPSAVFSDEERPFQPPFLASAHQSLCSGVLLPSRAFSGGVRSEHSRFASASRSQMDGFSFVSSRLPLLMIPSTMP